MPLDQNLAGQTTFVVVPLGRCPPGAARSPRAPALHGPTDAGPTAASGVPRVRAGGRGRACEGVDGVEDFGRAGTSDRSSGTVPAATSGSVRASPTGRHGTPARIDPIAGRSQSGHGPPRGGGSRGNVGAGTLTVLTSSIVGIARLENLKPATGGVEGQDGRQRQAAAAVPAKRSASRHRRRLRASHPLQTWKLGRAVWVIDRGSRASTTAATCSRRRPWRGPGRRGDGSWGLVAGWYGWSLAAGDGYDPPAVGAQGHGFLEQGRGHEHLGDP